MKTLRRMVVSLILLVVLVAVGALFGLDYLAKMGVEEGGTYALGVDTSLESLSLSLIGGRLTMDGLRVDNPEGFTTPHLMKSGRFDVELRPGSVFEDTVELHTFELDGLDVNIEQQLTGSNIAKIVENLKRFETEGKQTKSGGKKVSVDRIVIKNVEAHFHFTTGLAATQPITIKIPTIELTDFKSDQAGGILVSELFSKIIPAIIDAVLARAEGTVPSDSLGGLSKSLAGLSEKLGENASKLGELIPTLIAPRKDD